MKYLITGSNGLVASHLIERLLKKEDNIVYAISQSNSRKQYTDLNHQVLSIDFTGDWTIEQLPDKIDCIIHLAQSADFRDFPKKAKDVFYVNTLSTLKLLDYAVKKDVKKFIWASTGGIYGFGDNAFEEHETISLKNNTNFYVSTKFASELLADSFQKQLQIVTLRIFFAYGPSQSANMLIPRLINNIYHQNPIQLQGENGLFLNPIYVDDLVESIDILSINDQSGTFNMAGNEVVSLRQICEIISSLLGKDAVFECDLNQKPNSLMGNISKIENYISKPSISLKEGLSKMIQSMKFN